VGGHSWAQAVHHLHCACRYEQAFRCHHTVSQQCSRRHIPWTHIASACRLHEPPKQCDPAYWHRLTSCEGSATGNSHGHQSWR
jgi:hypothetical protein